MIKFSSYWYLANIFTPCTQHNVSNSWLNIFLTDTSALQEVIAENFAALYSCMTAK